MALGTLKDVKEIDGFEIVVMDTLREKQPELFRPDGSMIYHEFDKRIRPNYFIYVRNDKNSISFNLQNGPIKEVGVNGCQVDTLIAAAMEIVQGLDKYFPCQENKKCMGHLQEAYIVLKERKRRREEAGIEGLNKETPNA